MPAKLQFIHTIRYALGSPFILGRAGIYRRHIDRVLAGRTEHVAAAHLRGANGGDAARAVVPGVRGILHRRARSENADACDPLQHRTVSRCLDAGAAHSPPGLGNSAAVALGLRVAARGRDGRGRIERLDGPADVDDVWGGGGAYARRIRALVGSERRLLGARRPRKLRGDGIVRRLTFHRSFREAIFPRNRTLEETCLKTRSRRWVEDVSGVSRRCTAKLRASFRQSPDIWAGATRIRPTRRSVRETPGTWKWCR